MALAPLLAGFGVATLPPSPWPPSSLSQVVSAVGG